MALQLMAMNGPSFLGPRRWMAWAIALHLGTGAEQSLEGFGLQLRLQCSEIPLETGDVEGSAKDDLQLFELNWFR